MPGLQRLQDRLPGQRRHGHLQGRVPCPPLRRPAASTRGLCPRLAACHRTRGDPEPSGPSRQRLDQQAPGSHDRDQDGRARGPSDPPLRGADPPAVVGRPVVVGVDRSRSTRNRAGVARHLHQPVRAAHRAGCRPGPRTRGLGRHHPDRTALLRAHLGLHRTAQGREEGLATYRAQVGWAHPRRRPRARAGAQLHGGVPIRRARVVPGRPRRLAAEGRHGHVRGAAHCPHAELGACRAAHGVPRRHRPGALPPARRLGFDADQQLLEKVGIAVEPLESGCCGLAGNFGFTAGHGQVSQALADRVLLPRVREAPPTTAVLADGFSCRTQIHDLGNGERQALHLAELVAAATRPGPSSRPHMAPDSPDSTDISETPSRS